MGVETALMAVALGSTAVGGAVQAAGALQEGRAAQDAGEFNRHVSFQQAASERDAAGAEASDYRRAEMRKISSARAARGATGVTMAGSPLLVDEATVREVALGSARIGHGGAVRANRLEQQGELYRMEGNAARKASYLRAGTSILNTASSFASTAAGMA